MRTHHHDIIVTDHDLRQLLPVVEHHALDSLDAELHRAVIVEQRAVPADVVTMNSELVYEDCATHAQRRVTLVYPPEADSARGRISVLAPIGAALLGLRVGQEIDWVVPSGTKRIKVVELVYQPEASGDYDR